MYIDEKILLISRKIGSWEVFTPQVPHGKYLPPSWPLGKYLPPSVCQPPRPTQTRPYNIERRWLNGRNFILRLTWMKMESLIMNHWATIDWPLGKNIPPGLPHGKRIPPSVCQPPSPTQIRPYNIECRWLNGHTFILMVTWMKIWDRWSWITEIQFVHSYVRLRIYQCS